MKVGALPWRRWERTVGWRGRGGAQSKNIPSALRGSPDSKKNYSREKGGGAKTKYETTTTVRTLPHGGGSCNCSPGGGQRSCRLVGRARV